MEVRQRGGGAPFRGDWSPVLDAIELVGPKGYIHGWIKVAEGAVARNLRAGLKESEIPAGARISDTDAFERARRQGFEASKGTLGREYKPTGERTPGEGAQSFAGDLKPGSMDHIRAIWDLGTLATRNTSDGRPSSDTLGNALHNVARSVAQRDMAAANAHMISARWGNDHEAGGAYTSELEDIAAQLPRVPKQELGWMPQKNPLMRNVAHPGRFTPTPGPPVNPTMNAMNIPSYIGAANEMRIAIELSAQTARLAVTPSPRGRPGGPGLYDVKGMGHSPYLQNIVKALIRKRGMPPGRAYAIARGAIRRWSTGGGHVHPEVRAAASAAEADELAKQARAKLAHGH